MVTSGQRLYLRKFPKCQTLCIFCIYWCVRCLVVLLVSPVGCSGPNGFRREAVCNFSFENKWVFPYLLIPIPSQPRGGNIHHYTCSLNTSPEDKQWLAACRISSRHYEKFGEDYGVLSAGGDEIRSWFSSLCVNSTHRLLGLYYIYLFIFFAEFQVCFINPKSQLGTSIYGRFDMICFFFPMIIFHL